MRYVKSKAPLTDNVTKITDRSRREGKENKDDENCVPKKGSMNVAIF